MAVGPVAGTAVHSCMEKFGVQKAKQPESGLTGPGKTCTFLWSRRLTREHCIICLVGGERIDFLQVRDRCWFLQIRDRYWRPPSYDRSAPPKG